MWGVRRKKPESGHKKANKEKCLVGCQTSKGAMLNRGWGGKQKSSGRERRSSPKETITARERASKVLHKKGRRGSGTGRARLQVLSPGGR